MTRVSGLLGETRLFEALEKVVRESHADATEVAYEGGVRHLARFAGSSIHQGLCDRSVRATVRVQIGARVGLSAAGAVDAASLRAALSRALAAAEASPEDPHFPGLPAPRPLRALSAAAFDEATAALDVDAKADLLGRCFERAALHGATLAGRFHTEAEELAVFSSRGVRAHHAGTRADVAFFADKDGASGHAAGLSRTAKKIDPVALAEAATEKALGARNPIALEPGAYDVVLEPAAVSEVLEWMSLVCFSARSVEDGSSFAADGLGRRVTGPRISLYDEGASDVPESLPQPFDLEGMPKGRLDLLRQGVVCGVAHDTRSAARAGVDTTGHAAEDALSGERLAVATHLFLQPGLEPATELCRKVERGIYVTRFHYVCGTLDPRRASMTGMTRDGTFLIENGRIGKPVGNLRWTESVLAAFERVAGISRERQAIPGFWARSVAVVPHLLIRGWSFTGRQEEG
jgi:predicted Zn-dependent protease